MNKILIKILNSLFVVIAAFPIIGMRITVYTIALFGLFTLILSIKERKYLTFFEDWKVIVILTSYFLLCLCSFLILGENTNRAFKLLETKALFIIFPILVYLSKDFLLVKKSLDYVLSSFVISNIIVCIYIWIKILSIGFLSLLELDTYYNPIFRKIFSETSGMHLPYLGMLFAFSAIIIIDRLYKREIKNSRLQVLAIVSVLLLLFSIMIFSARMAFLAFSITMLYYFLKKASNRKIIIFIVSLLLFSYLVSFLGPVKRRIEGISNISFALPKEGTQSHQVNFRFVIYNCSISVLKTYWLTGVGLGDTQDAMDLCYKEIEYKNYDDFSKLAYNTHNQYLNELLTHGVLGILIFILPLIHFYIKSDGLYRMFLLLVFLCLITENLFQREIGVIFFTMFNTLFYFNALKKKL